MQTYDTIPKCFTKNITKTNRLSCKAKKLPLIQPDIEPSAITLVPRRGEYDDGTLKSRVLQRTMYPNNMMHDSAMFLENPN